VVKWRPSFPVGFAGRSVSAPSAAAPARSSAVVVAPLACARALRKKKKGFRFVALITVSDPRARRALLLWNASCCLRVARAQRGFCIMREIRRLGCSAGCRDHRGRSAVPCERNSSKPIVEGAAVTAQGRDKRHKSRPALRWRAGSLSIRPATNSRPPRIGRTSPGGLRRLSRNRCTSSWRIGIAHQNRSTSFACSTVSTGSPDAAPAVPASRDAARMNDDIVPGFF